MKKRWYIPTLLLVANLLAAQSPYFKFHEMEDAFKRTPAEVVYEDHNSSLWFGSPKGLFLYDGLEFHHFQKEDSTSNHVSAIFRDGKKRLWVGYADGSVCQVEKQKLSSWRPDDITAKSAVNGFAEDELGNVWISTERNGLFCFLEKTPEENGGPRLRHFTPKDGLPEGQIHTLTSDESGRIWLGSEGGLTACSFAEGKIITENLGPENRLSGEAVLSILPDGKGKLWLGLGNGTAVRFDPATLAFSDTIFVKNTDPVTSLALFEGIELWLGTASTGLWRYAFADSTLRPVNRFRRTRVHDLHRDTEGNIWVLTSDHGIHSANRQFEFITTDFERTRAVLCDSKNRLWVGTAEGLFEFETNEKKEGGFVERLPRLNLDVGGLFEDEWGHLWVGAADGLYALSPSTNEVRRVLAGRFDVESIDGKNGHLFLATLDGAIEIEYEEDILDNGKTSTRTLLDGRFVHKVFADSKGRTWFGTEGQAVHFLENGEIKKLTLADHVHPGGQPGEEAQINAVYSITEDQNGHLWFSTDRGGIFEFDGEKFHHLDLKEGIRDLEITSLATDARGHILIVHPSGVDVLTPGTRHLIYYDDEVGIRGFAPSLNAICTDPEGNVWMGGKNMLIKYTSLKEDLEIHPRTSLNNVSMLLEPIDFSARNVFAYDENHLAFSYMGLWYTDPQIVKYRYRLEGYDLDWIESKDRRATYSNLPPGDYTFRVMSTENDAWSDEPIVDYYFEIKPPIWMRWWFIALLIPFLLGLFFLYQKNRDQRIQLVNLMEKDKAESKLATLKAQINPHFLFNSFNTLISVVEQSPEQAVEYIENLADFYRKIMQLRDKDIISLREEVELLQNYSYLLKKRYGNNFQLHLELPARDWYIVPLTLQLLVENAVKHNIISKSKPLTVRVLAEDSEYISVANNLQPKLTQENSTYFGLQSLVQRYEYLKQKKVKVEKDGGTFKVSIPIIK